MGNGARAQQKRERNAGKNGGTEAKSQLKSNQAAQNIKCKVCMQTFLSTSRKPALVDHVKAKHDGKKTYEECFAGQDVKE